MMLVRSFGLKVKIFQIVNGLLTTIKFFVILCSYLKIGCYYNGIIRDLFERYD